jgi:uncharacterized membrane protein YphA (DoxX/SURF4 family)
LQDEASLGLLIRFVLGTIFLWSGASKMTDLGDFADAIRLYRLIPRVTAGAAARLVAWVEATLGTALLVGIGVSWASRVGIGLLAIFTVAIGINLFRGRRIPCGCRRNSTEPIQIKHILRNSVALLALAYLAGLPAHRWAVDSFLGS